MANELQFSHYLTGAAVYAILRSPTGRVWDGSSFVTQVNADWADYALPLTETPSGGKFYVADFPTGAGGEASYTLFVFQRPAEEDPSLSDAQLAYGTLGEFGAIPDDGDNGVSGSGMT
jgi:hypothetical protein